MMQDIGLGAREVGLTAMVARMQEYARRAAAGNVPSTT
jgi:hypothetical protein